MAQPATEPISLPLLIPRQNTELVRIDRDDYNRVLRSGMLEVVNARANFLAAMPVLSKFHLQHLVRVASFFKRERYAPRRTVMGQGVVTCMMWVVEEGEVLLQRVVKPGQPPQRLLALGKGCWFGAIGTGTVAAGLATNASLVGTAAELAEYRVAGVSATSLTDCVLIGIERTEFSYRAGKAALLSLDAADDAAWRARKEMPGPLGKK